MSASRIASPLLLAPILVPFVFSEMAFAQQQQALDPNVTVWNRPRPEYDALGMRAGSFRVLPVLAFTGAYSDNVNFDENGEQSDYFATVRPSVAFESDWSRHALNTELGGEFRLNEDQTNQDYEDFFANGDGTIEVSRQTRLRANLGVDRGHQGADDNNNDEVEQFTAVDGGLSVSHQLNRVTLTLSGDAERVEFDDNSEEDENRYEYNALLRTAYDVSPRLDVFVEGRYNILDYDENQIVNNVALDQDSDGYEARFGAGLNLTSVLFGEAFVGYRVQEFEQGGDDESGISFGAELNWNVTQLTSIGITGQRDFEPSDQAGANSNFQTQFGVTVAHEVLRNMIVDGSAAYENDNFRGDDRNDDTYRLGAGATYWVNRNVSLNAGYDYSERSSNQANQDFKANEISIGLTLRL